jgi:YHS domain-containing protein
MKKPGLLFVFVLCVNGLLAQEVFMKSGVAIGGYDPVAYFKEGKAVEGKEDFKLDWKGASWHFSNADNLAEFKSNPEKYAPQFGGYCAYGTADNHKAPTQPDAWTIVGGKLYLNYNSEVMKIWREDQKNLIDQAVRNWPTVKLQKD